MVTVWEARSRAEVLGSEETRLSWAGESTEESFELAVAGRTT